MLTVFHSISLAVHRFHSSGANDKEEETKLLSNKQSKSKKNRIKEKKDSYKAR